ncbi:O-fut1, partial [Symbiodinium natans]
MVNHTIELFAPIGEGLVFRGREFLHRRPCCLGAGERSLVLLLHYVPADFPEFQCESMVNVSAAKADDLLLYQCQALMPPDPAGIGEASAPAPKPPRQRYLLYNPCATNFDPHYCQSQFNNQVVFFLHALSVAKGLGRRLVLPPFMWMEHQMAESQRWFPFEHFFDLEHLKERFDVISLEEFLSLEDLAHPGGQKLWWYFYPPYLVEK